MTVALRPVRMPRYDIWDTWLRLRIASRCLNESLQVLANLVNSSDECGTTLSSFKGAITGLGRVMLRRHRISRTSEDRDGKRLRSTESGNDSIRRGQEAPRNDDEASPQDVTPEEILCVALAILTSSVLSDRNAADSIVTTSA